jgi:hypothetical protein
MVCCLGSLASGDLFGKSRAYDEKKGKRAGTFIHHEHKIVHDTIARVETP